MIMEKINIVELLKDCPTGMELDSPMYDNLYFDRVEEDYRMPISCYTIYHGSKNIVFFTEFGSYNEHKTAKCVIFPKGKTTWEGFVPPCKFKDGDVVVNASNKDSNAFIYAGENNNYYECYVGLATGTYPELSTDKSVAWVSKTSGIRLATEEEKQKLFQAIKDNGYTWNPETKTLKKLIEPKFKVGDRIVDVLRKHMGGSGTQGVISKITDDKYIFTDGSYMSIGSQDNWELAPNKFDISTLVPFESRVLVRTKLFHDKWIAGFFSHKDSYEFAPFWTTADKNYQQCIPYEGNEHLLGKTDDCDEFYKTWE